MDCFEACGLLERIRGWLDGRQAKAPASWRSLQPARSPDCAHANRSSRLSIYAGLDPQKTVGWICVLSFVFCLAAIYAILAAVEFDASIGYLPVEAIKVADAKLVFAWGIFDFLGYYMLRIPIIVFLWRWFRSENPVLVDFAGCCGLLFVVLSVTATSILTGATTGILAVYPKADPSLQLGLEAAWEASVAAVRQGLWQFSMLPWLIWTGVMGSLLATREVWLGRGLQSISVAAAISAIDPVFGAEGAANLRFVSDYQVHFSSVWVLWAGIVLLRRPSGLRDAGA